MKLRDFSVEIPDELAASLATLLTAHEIADLLRISTSTVTRCVQKGAPVHRWGPVGHQYRINPYEFVAWMESNAGKSPTARPQESTAPVAPRILAEQRQARMKQRLSEATA